MLEEQVKNTGSAFWACRPCTAYSQGITRKVKDIDMKVTGLQEEVKEMQQEVKGIQSELKLVDSRVKKMEGGVQKLVEDNNKVIFEEMRERESRRLNVVMHGVPEHPDQAAPGKEKQTWDKSLCIKICKALDLDYSEEVIKFCRRVGTAEEGPRPLVAGFYTEMEKSMLMRRAKQLEETEYKEVKVAHDLTRRQRKEERDLWVEMEAKNGTRTEEQLAKNLAWAVVGARGEKRLVIQPSRQGPPPARGNRRGRGRPATSRPPRTEGQQQLLQALRGRGGLAGGARGRPAARLPTLEVEEDATGSAEREEEEMDGVADELADIPAAQSQKRKAATALEGQPPDKEKR